MTVTTFVTSFFYIYSEDYDHNKTIPWRIERFREIVETGIQLCVYVCPTFEKYVKEIADIYPNVKIMRTMSISETWIHKICSENEYSLPSSRHLTKDLDEYMMVINSKTEFMADAIEKNPWNSSHFAWIDFNISHVFFDKAKSLEHLRVFGTRTFAPKFFAIPGCWKQFDNQYITHITECIYWRFCGGFFIGDAESILDFHRFYQSHFPEYLRQHKKLIWEVNFWAWLESNSEWRPTWYKADHNDAIISNMSASFYSLSLRDLGSEKYKYGYPNIDGYHMSSASYLKYGDKHLLNTRYVNYWYYNDGGYMFYDGKNIIRTKNIFSELNLVEDGGPDILVPMDYVEMNETIDLPKYELYSRGIEDIRLYEYNGRVKYIATTVGYHTTGGNRMMIGNYDFESQTYSDSCLVEPPGNTWCEKNWVPVKDWDLEKNRELFIYKWSPMEIGEIVLNSEGVRKLEIIQRFHETERVPLFHKMRGSAPFVEYGGEMVGVIHFSEETKPRHYFHMMVVLDKDTMQPLRYSEPFYFENISIEFCIGFDIRCDKYWFWISQYDRDPLLIALDVNKLLIQQKI